MMEELRRRVGFVLRQRASLIPGAGDGLFVDGGVKRGAVVVSGITGFSRRARACTPFLSTFSPLYFVDNLSRLCLFT